jgi:hypothetical protein
MAETKTIQEDEPVVQIIQGKNHCYLTYLCICRQRHTISVVLDRKDIINSFDFLWNGSLIKPSISDNESYRSCIAIGSCTAGDNNRPSGCGGIGHLWIKNGVISNSPALSRATISEKLLPVSQWPPLKAPQ